MKTNVRTTSLFAYHGEVQQKMGRKQELVMEAFFNNTEENLTNTELAYILNWPINTVVPRVFELRRMGKLKESDRRKCRVTGRHAIAWCIKD